MGWIGNVFLLAAALLVGKKLRSAFVFSFVGNGFWMACGVQQGMLDLVVISGVFMAVSLRNWYLWRS